MKNTNLNLRLWAIFSLISLIACSNKKSSSSSPMNVKFLNSTIHFANQEEGAKLLGTSDAFSQSQSPFDLAAKTPGEIENTEDGYLNYAASQALNWSDKEIEKTKKIIAESAEKIKALNLKFELPNTINLVLSTGNEEGGAVGYTREDYIVLKESPDEHLFLHELFHVISRHNPELRNAIYEVIGFEFIGKLEYPNDLAEFKITNPDAPFFEHAAQVKFDGQDHKVVLLTIANKPYESGSFFQYLTLVFLELDEQNKPILVDGKSKTYSFAEAQNFSELIGKNTSYVIHPEEVSAEHFTMLVLVQKVPDLDFILELQKAFNN